MKICIDPGHGFENTHPKIHDPGATVTRSGVTYKEATINLSFALRLEKVLQAVGHETILTRRDETTSCPVHRRAAYAEKWGADLLVSLHCNSFEATSANGMEIQWRDQEDRELADLMLPRLLAASGLKDHGNDQRVGLSILQFRGPAILIELGFLTNDHDRAVLMDLTKRVAICEAIAQSIEVWDLRRAKPAPAAVPPANVPAHRICPTCGQVRK